MKQMLLFAHMGITLGVAWLPSHLVRQESPHSERTLEDAEEAQRSHISLRNRVLSCARQLDYRILLVGSLLPDIIDKPTGFLFPTLNSGRGFAHSLFFAIIILLLSFYLYIKYKSFKGVSLSFGSLMHLILDEMWLFPQILLWPLYGWGFEGFEMLNLGNFLQDISSILIINRVVFAFELIGALILAAFFLKLLRQKKLGTFLKTGGMD